MYEVAALVNYLMCGVRCSVLFAIVGAAVWCVLLVVASLGCSSLLFVVCWLLFVVCCLLFVCCCVLLMCLLLFVA